MTSAFCPGHVSCVFQPVRSYDAMSAGSRGVGIKLSLGARAEVEPRTDGVVEVLIDGEPSEAPVTRRAVTILAPSAGFDIRIENDLPVGQGFGMSAAGSIAASLCVARIAGLPRQKAFAAAHVAEVECSGGLGDVSAIMAGRDVPVRTVGGLPPHGAVTSAGFFFPKLTLAVLGPKMDTPAVLGGGSATAAVREAGSAMTDEFLRHPTRERLFEVSNRFSRDSGLEGPEVRRAIDRLNAKGYGTGMCMLGNSVFTDAPAEVVRAALGRGRAKVYICSSTSRDATVLRGSDRARFDGFEASNEFSAIDSMISESDGRGQTTGGHPRPAGPELP